MTLHTIIETHCNILLIEINSLNLQSYKILVMLQIAFIRENQEKVVKALAKKHMDAKAIVEEIIQSDELRRSTQADLENTLAESNKLSKERFN